MTENVFNDEVTRIKREDHHNCPILCTTLYSYKQFLQMKYDEFECVNEDVRQ